MSGQSIHAEKQHHIDMKAGDIAPTVLIPGDPGRVKVFAELMDEAHKVAEKREYITYTGNEGRGADQLHQHGAGLSADGDRGGGVDPHWGEEHHPHWDVRGAAAVPEAGAHDHCHGSGAGRAYQ